MPAAADNAARATDICDYAIATGADAPRDHGTTAVMLSSRHCVTWSLDSVIHAVLVSKSPPARLPHGDDAVRA